MPRELQETIGHKEIIISLRTADAQRAEALYVREQAKVLARLKRRAALSKEPKDAVERFIERGGHREDGHQLFDVRWHRE